MMELEEHAKSLAKRAKSRVGNVIVAYEVKKWPEGRLEQLLKMRVLRSLPDADEIRCPGCTERHMIVPIRTILPNGESYSEHLCGKEGLIEIPAFLFKRRQIVIDKMIELGYLDEEGADATTTESAPIYVEINAAERTVTVGASEYRIASEKTWDFFTTLIGDKKKGRHTPRMDRLNNWKNAVDTLRRQIGKDNLKHMLHFAGDGYYLQPTVKIKYSSQVAIRKTKLKRPRRKR